MAEFMLRTTQEGTPIGAVYRDGTEVFHAFGFYADMFYDDGELNKAGLKLAEGKAPLLGYSYIGSYSTDKIRWEKNATSNDIGWLSSLDYR